MAALGLEGSCVWHDRQIQDAWVWHGQVAWILL